MIAIIIVELILRTTNIIPLAYRSFEVMNRPHSEYKNIKYLQPETSICMTEIGDLGAMLGKTEYQVKKEICTETEELGYRNHIGQKDSLNETILLGDSYTMGIGLDQKETISSLLGGNCYNL